MILKKLHLNTSKIEINSDFSEYVKVFLDKNSRLNLMSKNDEKLLFEKHVYDSLAIKLLFNKLDKLPELLLDIGTGGGFPSIPIAVEYPNISVVGVDSILKKVNAVTEMAEALGLKNIKFIRDRVENLRGMEFDVITSRAVAQMSVLIEYAYPLLKQGGYLVLYKSRTAEDELESAKPLIRRLHLKIEDIIEYRLPLLEGDFDRRLVVLRK